MVKHIGGIEPKGPLSFCLKSNEHDRSKDWTLAYIENKVFYYLYVPYGIHGSKVYYIDPKDSEKKDAFNRGLSKFYGEPSYMIPYKSPIVLETENGSHNRDIHISEGTVEK